MEDCIFCKIAKKEIPAKIVYEDDDVLAFPDISPKAPVHILIVPKKHIGSVNELENKDAELVGKMVLAAKKLAKEYKVDQSGYRLILNTGQHSGQTVPHLHLHLMGGKLL